MSLAPATPQYELDDIEHSGMVIYVVAPREAGQARAFAHDLNRVLARHIGDRSRVDVTYLHVTSVDPLTGLKAAAFQALEGSSPSLTIWADAARHTLTYQGHEVFLTPKKWRLFEGLARALGQIVPLEETHSWGFETPLALRTQMTRLRQELAAFPVQVITHRQVGYQMTSTVDLRFTLEKPPLADAPAEPDPAKYARTGDGSLGSDAGTPAA